MGETAQKSTHRLPAPLARRRPISITVTPGTLWLVAGIIALFIGLAIALTKGIFVFILLFVGIIFAEGLRPAVEWQERRHIPRPAGVLLLYLALVLIVVGLGYLLVEPVISQASRLSNQLPTYSDRITAFIHEIQNTLGGNSLLANVVDSLRSSMSGALGGIVKGLIQIPVTVVSVIFSIVVVAVIAFFWLTGIERLKPFFVSLFPYQIQPDVSDVLAEMGHRVGGYVRGVGINMLVIGMLSGAVDFFLGVPYPVLLGIFAGLTELIPYFGPWIGGAPAVLLGLISGGPILALEVVAGYIIIQEIEGHTLVPFVMMRAVKVNPLTVVIAVLLGTELLGVVGGILAVPAATIIHVLMVRVVGPAARQMAGHVSDSGVMPIESDEPPTNVQKEHGEADQPADKAGMRH